MKMLCKVGDLHFSVVGEKENPYYRAFREYFTEKRIKPDGEAIDLKIEVREKDADDSFFGPELFSLSGGIAFNREWYRVRKYGYSYAVRNLFEPEKPTELVLFPRPTRSTEIRRVGNTMIGDTVGDHDRYGAFVASLANYSCLWYIFSLTLMKKNSIFVHCGMMAKNGKGMLLTGTGGCGKTSTMMELITNSGYSFMAEDFGILRQDGVIFDMQKKAAVYQSDVKWGNEYLKHAVDHLQKRSRINWKVKKAIGKNPLHYFKPSEIFGSNIAHSAQLEDAYILKRIPKDSEIKCTDISSASLANRMKSASFRELKELYEVLSNLRAVGGDDFTNYPSVFEIENAYLEIANKALSQVRCHELAVPLNVEPEQTAKAMLAGREEDGNA